MSCTECEIAKNKRETSLSCAWLGGGKSALNRIVYEYCHLYDMYTAVSAVYNSSCNIYWYKAANTEYTSFAAGNIRPLEDGYDTRINDDDGTMNRAVLIHVCLLVPV